jgi:hypothetical protein
MKGKLIKTTSVFVTYAFQNPPLSSSTYLCPIKIESTKKASLYFSSLLFDGRHVPNSRITEVGWNGMEFIPAPNNNNNNSVLLAGIEYG